MKNPGILSFIGQDIRQLDGVFLSNAMMEEYGERVEGSPEFKKLIITSVEESLKRVGTDYFDIVHCPHAATCPEEISNPAILEAFRELLEIMDE